MAGGPPRILFISHDSGRTGAPIGLLAFMRWLKENTNWETGCILRSAGPLEPSFRELGPTLTLGRSTLARSRVGRRIRRLLPQEVRNETAGIRRMFARGRYELIYSNTITNGQVLETLAPYKVPAVTHVHELEYWIGRAGPANLRQVMDRSSAYIAASDAVRRNLVDTHRIPPDRISVVYEHIRELPPVPSREQRLAARKRLGVGQDAFVIGTCGAEHWRKGRDLIPQLLAALRRQDPRREFHVAWVGRPGTAEEEYALGYDLRQSGMTPFFHSTGEVANPFEFFGAFDAFALLSRDDPYPLACLEIAAMEVPVVCFENAGGIPEFIRGGCGFSVPYLDLEAMARTFAGLAADREQGIAAGKRARAKVAGENTVERTAPKLMGVMQQALANGTA